MEFTTLDDFSREMKSRRDKKIFGLLAKQNLRAVEEAKCYLSFPIADRDKIFAISLKLQEEHKKNVTDILAAVDLNDEANFQDLKCHLQTLFQTLQNFDQNQEVIQKAPKQRRTKSPPSTRFFLSDRLLDKSLKQMNKPAVEIKDEKQRVKKKRAKREMDDDIAGTPTRAKKAKISEENSLADRFLADVFEANLERTSAANGKVCEKCFDTDNFNTISCSGEHCGKRFHKECMNETQNCGDCPSEKLCSYCNLEIKQDDKTVECKKSDCTRSYHADCLKNYPLLRKTCPQHFCHTCKDGKHDRVASCIKCSVAYHLDVYCLPAGTQVLTKTQIICPRHKAAEEMVIQKQEKNVGWCCECYEGGDLILCDGCPRSFHTGCHQPEHQASTEEKFFCCNCTEGKLPTYYSIVWAKVGRFRHWPAFVMLPYIVPYTVEKVKRFARQFCVRFFGTYDYFYVTSEQVIPFEPNRYDIESLCITSPAKKLEFAYNTAIKEAFDMNDILKQEYQKPTFNKPKPFHKISINRVVPPLVLKKPNKDDPNICNCSRDDTNPCGKDSSCINRALFIECDLSCPTGDKCQNMKLRKREGVELKVVKTAKCGFGVVCNEDIEERDFIAEYVGELINQKEFEARMEKKQNDKLFYFHSVATNIYVDAEYYGNYTRFINHSCDPNCVSRKIIVDGNIRIAIISNQFIKAVSYFFLKKVV
jgi:hypothetical protein